MGMQWGLKTHPRPVLHAGVKGGVKGGFQDTQETQQVKGRPHGGYRYGGWGHQGYQVRRLCVHTTLSRRMRCND